MSQVACCCFSPDGATILSGSGDKTLKLWRTCDGSLINTLNGHTDYVQQPHFHLGSHITQVMCCCFSPDGSTILSCAYDKTLKLWRTRDGSLISTLNGHTNYVTTTSSWFSFTQVTCCCFSPDGSTILSGSGDKTLKLWRTRDGSFSSTLFGDPLCRDIQVLNIPKLVERDMCSFLEHESGVPLSETTNKVLEMLCEPSDKGFSIRSAGLQLVVSQLETFCSKSTEQLDALIKEHDELKCGVDDSDQEVQEHVEEVERIRLQLAEAEKQLMSARQKHETLVDQEKKCFERQKISTVKAEELRKIRDFYKGELDKTRSVINQLSSKLKQHRCVSCLSQEEVLLFLQELDIPKSIRDSFKKNQVGGKALTLISDRDLRELGMSDINQRKVLLHSIYNVRENGCIRVAPPPAGACCGDGLAAWWSADEVWKWLKQDFRFQSLKGLTGQALIHLSDEDISQFGLPLGPALELKEKCKTLQHSFFSSFHNRSNHQARYHQREFIFVVYLVV